MRSTSSTIGIMLKTTKKIRNETMICDQTETSKPTVASVEIT